MPIQSLNARSLQQRCIACGTQRTIGLEQLETGILSEHADAATVVVLPTCPGCGSVEFLFGSSEDQPDHTAPGSYGHLQRLLVNHLHAELVDADRISDESRGRASRLKRPGDDVLAQWFPHGLTIDQGPPTVTGGTAQ
jgi:hypothetical protein